MSKVDSRLDRALQRDLLDMMRSVYPRGVFPTESLPADELTIAANLRYLEEHGLCDSGLSIGMDGHLAFSQSTITATGLDFLEQDGGLSAILGVVTVRLHADTIRDLIAAKIEETALPEPEKSALRKSLSGLSETALRAASTDLVQTGLRHLPDAAQWLRTLVGL